MQEYLHSCVQPSLPPTGGGSAKRLLLRGCHQISPYRAGWEDTRYTRQYMNPFTPGSAAWWDYEAGNQDARKAVLL